MSSNKGLGILVRERGRVGKGLKAWLKEAEEEGLEAQG